MAWFDKKKEDKVVVEKPDIIESIKTNMPDKTDEITVSKLPELDPTPAVIEAAPSVSSVVVPEIPKGPVVDALSLVYYVWVLYKLNIITRIQVRDFLDIIKRGDWPVDVVKYLNEEVKKL